ncbi:MAG: 3,4-dehydroadipyl-CoA semialdehyde dehydrogenase [Planctomycetota bacterium]
MRTLRCFVEGRWWQAEAGFRPLINPCTEEPIAQASSSGLDFGAALAFARTTGGEALRSLTIPERAGLLAAMSKALHERRDELIELSLATCGTTRKDAKFDLDGATGTLYYYASLGKDLGDGVWQLDGDGVQLGRSARSWGQHLRLPKRGVAIHINAFNFPCWGFAEKAACALLAGVPVLTKPATSTAWLTERCVEIVVEAGILPRGSLSLVCGSLGDAFDHLQGQDVVAFTGSADTALRIREHRNLLRQGVAVNVEADSLNAAVLAPDVEEGSETLALFYRDVERELTQKSGQKCTAVRRIFAPRERLDEIQRELTERLSRVVVGNPAEPSVTMGPLATREQLDAAVHGVERLRAAATLVLGTGERVNGLGAAPGTGYFFGPTLLRREASAGAGVVHELEVFGPVATLLGYDGDAGTAAADVGASQGTLVTSLYSDDAGWIASYLRAGGATTGRVYLGSEKGADQAPGSGVALPQMLHGGPGRAGGGAELGGQRGLALYQQTVGVMGDRALVDRVAAQ